MADWAAGTAHLRAHDEGDDSRSTSNEGTRYSPTIAGTSFSIMSGTFSSIRSFFDEGQDVFFNHGQDFFSDYVQDLSFDRGGSFFADYTNAGRRRWIGLGSEKQFGTQRRKKFIGGRSIVFRSGATPRRAEALSGLWRRRGCGGKKKDGTQRRKKFMGGR